MAGGGLSFNMGTKKGPKLAFGLKGQQKTPRAPAVFAADSDDESTEQALQKRQRTSSTEAPGPVVSAAAPLDPEEQRTADKLAEFVAKHGRSFEEVTRQRNSSTGPFKFLFDTSSQGYKYYEQRLGEMAQAKQQQKPGFLAATPMPAAPPPAMQFDPVVAAAKQAARAVLSAVTPPSMAATGAVLQHADEGKTTTKSQQSEDSLAAMEAFTKMAAKRDEAKEEREAKMPLLNETSYDRRRTMAVYKNDGTRGHHMQDYIPPEELAKFLAKSGSEEAKAQAEALEAANRIQSDNIGHKLLSQMGWKEGQGLGAQNSGMSAPVAATGFGSEKRGLGAEEHLAPKEGDDEFEAYRKRMMLGYKHRPNPLGNPRKSYY